MPRRRWKVAELLQLDENEMAEQVEALARQLDSLLADRHPAVVGAVLAEMSAKLIAGYQNDDLREGIRATHLAYMDRLISVFDNRDDSSGNGAGGVRKPS